jgi:hypothetical protein
MAYATVAQLKAYLDIDSSGDDALLALILDDAHAMIDRMTHRTFEATADTTRLFDYPSPYSQLLLFPPRVTLAQAPTTIINGDGATIAASDYVMEPRAYGGGPFFGIRLKSDATWTFDDDPEAAISITGRWAWSVTPPDDIRRATIRLAMWIYRQRGNNADAERPLIAEGGVVALPAALPKDVIDVLEPYMRAL